MVTPDSLRAALSDRYHLDRELGQGGMATVYQAHDLKHDRDVAIKVLRPELAAVLGRDRFLAEIRLTARLDHPHILTLIDSGESDGFFWYVLPFVRGESLRERLNREQQLGVEEALAITQQIAGALDYAHQHGVIHRDIKPENILLHEGEAILADFGIALAVREAAGNRLTETGISLGTPQYMSPEQATADRQLDARSDIYSLAAVLYEMLAGEPPLSGPTAQAIIAKLMTERPTRLRVIRDTVSEGVDAAVAKALAKTPADRHASVSDFVTALRSRPSVPRRRFHLRRRRIAAASLLVLVVATAVVAGAVLRRPGTAAPPVHRQVVYSPISAIAGPALSPDGKLIAYVSHDSGLIVQDWAAGSVVRVADSVSVWGSVRWSPSGTHLLFQSGRKVLEIPRLGGAARVLASLPERQDVASAYSPDGRSWVRFVHAKPMSFFITQLLQPPGTEDTVRVPLSWVDDIDWSERAGWAAIARDVRMEAVVRVSVNGAHIDTLFSRNSRVGYTTILSIRWGLEGSAVFFSLDNELVRVSLNKRSPEPVMSGIPIWGFDRSSNGRILVYNRALRQQSKVLVFTFEPRSTGQPSLVEVTDGTLWTGDPALSPDGSKLAFARGPRPWTADLYVAPATGGPATRLTSDSEGIRSPFWSPDGRRLSYKVLATRGLDVLELSTGQARQVAEDVYRVRQQWRHPDGWIDSATVAYFDDSARVLAAVNVLSGDRVRLDTMWDPVPSPDARSIAWISGFGPKRSDEQISIYDRATGARRNRMSLPGFATPLAWSDDGLLTVALDDSTDALRLFTVRASGGRPKLLYSLPQCLKWGRITLSRNRTRVACESLAQSWSTLSDGLWVVENFDARP